METGFHGGAGVEQDHDIERSLVRAGEATEVSNDLVVVHDGKVVPSNFLDELIVLVGREERDADLRSACVKGRGRGIAGVVGREYEGKNREQNCQRPAMPMRQQCHYWALRHVWPGLQRAKVSRNYERHVEGFANWERLIKSLAGNLNGVQCAFSRRQACFFARLMSGHGTSGGA